MKRMSLLALALLMVGCAHDPTQYRTVNTFTGPTEYPARRQAYKIRFPGYVTPRRQRVEYYSPDNPPPPMVIERCFIFDGHQRVEVACD